MHKRGCPSVPKFLWVHPALSHEQLLEALSPSGEIPNGHQIPTVSKDIDHRQLIDCQLTCFWVLLVVNIIRIIAMNPTIIPKANGP